MLHTSKFLLMLSWCLYLLPWLAAAALEKQRLGTARPYRMFKRPAGKFVSITTAAVPSTGHVDVPTDPGRSTSQ